MNKNFKTWKIEIFRLLEYFCCKIIAYFYNEYIFIVYVFTTNIDICLCLELSSNKLTKIQSHSTITSLTLKSPSLFLSHTLSLSRYVVSPVQEIYHSCYKGLD